MSRMRVFGVSSTTHKLSDSTSGAMLDAALRVASERGHVTRRSDAARLHIVENLSCYADGSRHCASPEAGPYRCWAQHDAALHPERHGGEDEMPRIYDGIAWADVVIWATSTRWMSHSAVMQKVIERLNTLENRVSVYGEASPVAGKRAGIVVAGQHYESQGVAARLQAVFAGIGFEAPLDGQLVWQRTTDLTKEQGQTSNRPHVSAYLATAAGSAQVGRFLDALGLV